MNVRKLVQQYSLIAKKRVSRAVLCSNFDAQREE